MPSEPNKADNKFQKQILCGGPKLFYFEKLESEIRDVKVIENMIIVPHCPHLKSPFKQLNPNVWMSFLEVKLSQLYCYEENMILILISFISMDLFLIYTRERDKTYIAIF